jgi:hypothetical protein
MNQWFWILAKTMLVYIKMNLDSAIMLEEWVMKESFKSVRR